MEAFSWLLISDLHLKSNYTTWNQSVVLRDLVRDINAQKGNYAPIRLVFVSGDLAHGGKPEQYDLVESFLTDLLGVLALEANDVFIVPGNHDIDRDINQLAFFGARTHFTNAENVERILSNRTERELLLSRLSAFTAFQNRFCPHLNNAYTDDGLAFFVQRNIGNVPIGIVGLNSALTCGNDDDKERIVIGDRPIIDVCEKVRGADLRLLITMLHHPLSWLADFDRRTFESRFLPMCDILQRGHLHEPGVTNSSTSMRTNCVGIAAGAGYVWRQFQNSYSIVTVDIASSTCSTYCYEYNNYAGSYHNVDSQKHPIKLRGEIPCSAPELSAAIGNLSSQCRQIAAYLAALILGKVSDIPLPIQDHVFMGSPEILGEVTSPVYRDATAAMLQLPNLLRAFPVETPIDQRVTVYGQRFRAFSAEVSALCELHPAFANEMKLKCGQCEQLCQISTSEPSSTFVMSLNQFAEEQDWIGLEQIARRYSTIDSEEVRRASMASLALALAHSDDAEKRHEAIKVVEELISHPNCSASELELAFRIYRLQELPEGAVSVLKRAVGDFSELPLSFRNVAMTFAIECGSIEIRKLLTSDRNGDNNG